MSETSCAELYVDSDEYLRNFEARRYARCNVQFIRNKSFWREMRMLQKDNIRDARSVIDHIERKLGHLKTMSAAWKSFCDYEEEVASRTTSLNTFHAIGEATCKLFFEMDTSGQRSLVGLLETLEVQVIPFALTRLGQHEKAVSSLWERGKACLLAWMLMESKVSGHYVALASIMKENGSVGTLASGSPNSVNALAARVQRDRWMLVTKYMTAVARQDRINDRCNQHFRALFLLAKDIENARISMVMRIAENYLTKVAEALQKCALFNKNALDAVRSLPNSAVVLGQRIGLAEELTRRVEDRSEGGNFTNRVERRWQERCQLLHPTSMFMSLSSMLMLSTTSSSTASASSTARIDYTSVPQSRDLLQHSSSLQRLFVFYREETGLLVNSWHLCLVAVTADNVLHLLPYPDATGGSGHTSSSSVFITNGYSGNGNSESGLALSQHGSLYLPSSAMVRAFDRDLQLEVALCFEEDIYNSALSAPVNAAGAAVVSPSDPSPASTSQALTSKPPSLTSSSSPSTETAVSTYEVRNADFRRLLQSVSLDELDAGREGRWLQAATLFGDADCDNSSSLFAWSSSSWLSTSSASSTPPYAHPLTIPDTPASSSSTNATAANVGSPLTTNTSSVAGAGGNSASTSASQVVLPLPSGPTFASSVPTATASTGSTDAQVNNSQAAFVATNWSLVPVQCSLDLTQSRVTLSPSAQATENLVEIVESAIDDTSYFVFSRTVERRLVLRSRVQQDAIELVALIQRAQQNPQR